MCLVDECIKHNVEHIIRIFVGVSCDMVKQRWYFY